MNLRRFLKGLFARDQDTNDRPCSKAVFSGFTRSFKKTRKENLKILVQS